MHCHTANETRGRAGRARQAEEAATLRANEVQGWARAHRVRKCNLMNEFGLVTLPIEWLDFPTTALASRQAYGPHIAACKKSLQTSGKCNPRVEVLLMRDELHNAYYDYKDLIFDTDRGKPNIRFNAIVGAHTQAAMAELHLDRPRHKDWQSVDVVLMTCDNTEQNVNMALSYGAADNMTADTRRKVTVWDVVWTLHNRLEGIAQAGGPADVQAAKWKLVKKDVQFNNPSIPATTFGSLLVVSQVKGLVWKKISKVMTGGVINGTRWPHHRCTWVHQLGEGHGRN